MKHASGQAMVSYGHGVAKAAGAGAATGAGVGGILTGLGNPLSRATANGRSSGNRAAAHSTIVPQRRGDVRWDLGRQGFGAPAPVGLIGGVQATGVGNATWQPALLAPNENIAVLSEQWGGSEGTAELDEAGAPSGADAVDSEGEVAEERRLPVVIQSTGWQQATPSSSPADVTPDEPVIPEGVVVGLSVDDLIQKLGRPHLAFRGVAGAGYSDQYIFELSDGTDLVVYVLDGVVSHLAIG